MCTYSESPKLAVGCTQGGRLPAAQTPPRSVSTRETSAALSKGSAWTGKKTAGNPFSSLPIPPVQMPAPSLLLKIHTELTHSTQRTPLTSRCVPW